MPRALLFSGQKITVVDDQKRFCELLTDLEKVRSFTPSIIVLDWRWRKMDSFDVARSLKGDQNYWDIPGLAATALDMLEDRE
jgi:CheY-like chemotaxis protein